MTRWFVNAQLELDLEKTRKRSADLYIMEGNDANGVQQAYFLFVWVFMRSVFYMHYTYLNMTRLYLYQYLIIFYTNSQILGFVVQHINLTFLMTSAKPKMET